MEKNLFNKYIEEWADHADKQQKEIIMLRANVSYLEKQLEEIKEIENGITNKPG